jgi:tyrosyl-tRNA synthetase
MGEDLPTLDVPAEGIRLGAACTALGFAASNGEAKRKIAEGAVRLDDEALTDPAFLIELASGATRKLSLGKKKHGILRGWQG